MKADVKPEPLQIIELRAENFKRLKAVTIRPDGAITQITGRNAQGKTSVLDAVAAALGGKTLVPKQPIKAGKNKGMVSVDLGRLKVTRHFTLKEGSDTEATDRLVVEFADGSRPKSPQAVLDELVGDLGFDPLAFTRLKPDAQFETLRQFVPEVDFDAIEKENKEDFDNRTAVGRRAREAEAAANAVVITGNPPKEKVDVAELRNALANAATVNSDIATRRQNREKAASDVDGWNTEAERLRMQAAELEKKAADMQAKLDQAQALPAEVDTKAIVEQLAVADSINQQVELLAGRDRLRNQAEVLHAQYADLTKAIELRDAGMRKAIADAKMPVEGLGFGDKSVTLNGVPFEQGSAAEQLRASTAIAMALNPQLKAILIRDGSLLDKDSLKLLAQIAEQNKFQVFLERVADGQPVGVVIEDGEVAS